MLKQCVKHLLKMKVYLQLTLLLLLLSNATPITAKLTTDTTVDGESRTAGYKEQYQKQHKYQHQKQSDKPNIVIIMIDDMGYNDVSFHGSNQILTPNMDALAYNGIILNRHYVPNLCTPSRASLLTGKFPIHTGMQHHVIINDEPWGLPLHEHLMPEVFRDAGYSTNLVGKWHLGFWRKEMTPTMRGFDHHYGYYSGYIDYFDHSHHMLNRNYSSGVDFRRDLKTWHEANGTYATEVFTQEAERIIEQHNAGKPLFLVMSHLAVHTGNEDNPMQALPDEVNKFSHITDPKRRIYAGMISSLDASVGRTMRALANKGILNNTIVLMYSDNGAPTVGIHSNAGSNFPFRGQKESPWEGALRSAGAIWSPLFNQKNYVSDQVIHAIDWLPTLASAAGIRLPAKFARTLDGINVWDLLSNRRTSIPRSLVHSMDDITWYTSYMNDTLKYINGTTWAAKFDGWLGDIPMEAEADPSASYYVQHVLSSTVHEVLGDHSLSNAQVEQMRKEATIRCPTRPEDPNEPIYSCEPLKEACIFNIKEDPCELYNLAKREPALLQQMQQQVDKIRLSSVPSVRVPIPDPLSDPARFNGTWQWWYGTGNSGGPKPSACNYLIVSLLLSSFMFGFVSVIF